MNLHSNILLSLLFLAGSSTMAFAGPGPDYWMRMQRPVPKAATPQATPSAQPATKPDLPGGLTCTYMLVPNTGGSKVPYTSVRCTPEIMKKDWRCQQACANSKKKG